MEVEFTPEQQQRLEALAAQQGEAPAELVRRLVDRALEQERLGGGPKPLKSASGLLAKYGPGPAKEDIDENRREMFEDFGERSL